MAGAYIPATASPEMRVCQNLFVLVKKMRVKKRFYCWGCILAHTEGENRFQVRIYD